MLDPVLREELKAIIREVVVEELQDLNDALWSGMDRALNKAFAPAVELLKTIDRNQTLLSDGCVGVEKALHVIQRAVAAKLDEPDPDDWWKGDDAGE